ncbi:OmpA family protein [Prosthecobacter fusiformis]|uniref:OmpA family protein n=1 Tax=Prosthecobacter fusiformis TaxID=48464 RepID=A0A4R7S471_9BACT|nr:OmpA family protein [Prosthecobacter fusiformis]TDU73141.1 OmpA family protein [Prosthecobacter fusiformis]
MRFSIFLITLALLPMVMILHGWTYTEKQLPGLRDQAITALRDQGIRSVVVDIRYLDLRIAGDAPDMISLEKARAAVRAIGPLRVVSDELNIPANLQAQQDADSLVIKGWLPTEDNTHEVTQLIRKLRPDLNLNTEELRSSPMVRWPDGEKAPLTADSILMIPIVEKLRVSPWLDITQDAMGLRLKGLLPANGLRSALVSALNGESVETLLESTHTIPSAFADPATLIPFVKYFFDGTSQRRFAINDQGEPLIEGAATRSLESEWLALLRPVTGGKKVTSNLTFYPSELHFPGRQLASPLVAQQAEALKAALAEQLISFEPGSSVLSSGEQARLAAMTPLLLTAGPAVRLVIGGHPSPDDSSARQENLAKTRAEQVYSFLVEQGLPASDVQIVAFDSVPAGTPGAPGQSDSVEILLR